MSYELDRKYSNQINEEPGFQIPKRNGASVCYKYLYFVIVGWEEAEDNIEDEDQVNDELTDEPEQAVSISWIFWVKECSI